MPRVNESPLTPPDHASWLRARVAGWSADLARARSRETTWSLARLATFAAAAAIWIPLRDTPSTAIGSSVVLLVLFGVCVRTHRRVRQQREFIDRLLIVTDEAQRRCGGKIELIRFNHKPAEPDTDAQLDSILDAGTTWSLTEQERVDLDIHEKPIGLFGLLNRTSSIIGARRLADWTSNLGLDRDRIEARQACVKWLEEHPEHRLRIMAAAVTLREQDKRVDAFIRAIRHAQPPPHPFLITALRVWSIPSVILTLALIVRLAAGATDWWRSLLGLLAFNLFLQLPVYKKLRRLLAPWQPTRPAIAGLAEAATCSAENLPGESELARLADAAKHVAEPHILARLSRRIDWSDTGGMMHTLLNVVAFYDVHVASSLLKIAVAHQAEILNAAAAVGDLEALCSLASFASEQPVRCYPELADERCLRIEGGVHPLIDPAHVVANDLDLGGTTRTWVISGSNMAGKSTFLRMAGLNVVLAQMGGTPTTARMIWSPVHLITDLRIRDDLSRKESYFLAEVRQLRRMMPEAANAGAVLGLIDEPFRGTNSQERIAASVAVTRHLAQSGHLFLIATHEQALTDLESDGQLANRHFREDLAETGPVFDYHLHPGPATVRNALRILERERFPRTLLEDAKRMSSNDTLQPRSPTGSSPATERG